MRQMTLETKRELSSRLNKAVCHCGNVHTPAKIIKKFINALHPTVRSISARFHNPNRNVIYLDLTDFATQEKELIRARTEILGPKQPQRMAVSTQRLALAQPKESRSKKEIEQMFEMHQERHHLVRPPQISYTKGFTGREMPRLLPAWPYCTTMHLANETIARGYPPTTKPSPMNGMERCRTPHIGG